MYTWKEIIALLILNTYIKQVRKSGNYFPSEDSELHKHLDYKKFLLCIIVPFTEIER